MAQSFHKTTKLPKQLLAQLGLQEGARTKRSRSGTGPRTRKDRRKAGRVDKKLNRPTKRLVHENSRRLINLTEKDPNSTLDEEESLPTRSKEGTARPTKSALSQVSRTSREVPEHQKIKKQVKVSRGVKDRLAVDDAEIQALERVLGIKSKADLPKAFEDEGLGDLLEGLDQSSDDGYLRKRRRNDEGDEWLKAKRRKAQGLESGNGELALKSERENDDASDGSGTEEDFEKNSLSQDEEKESFFGFDDIEEVVDQTRAPKKRENPYVVPLTPNVALKDARYIPPSLRESNVSNEEDLSLLRRQVQGLLNRLSDANIIAILGDIEKLYRDHPRQHVSSTLIELLSGLIFDPSALPDTFIILHAGFVSSVFKVIGADVGAQMIQKSVAQFDCVYKISEEEGGTEKKLRNVIAFLAYLYSFQVVGSNLIYDFIRLILEQISERNTELLLKIVQTTGPQLRQDDPSSLKGIVYLLQSALARVAPEDVSVRSKFMVETINNLKNNRMKTGLAASSISSEHIVRMKKILGSLNTRSIKASEPLRIGLKDIRHIDKRGKWWLVGASYKDEEQGIDATPSTTESQEQGTKMNAKDIGFSNDLLDLAKAHRMNTDIRRSIFITLMSATDYRDAHIRLLKLQLKKAQELEVPKVLLHCAAVEQTYNPYYTLVSRKLCTDRRLKMSFQFALWDAFKRMGGEEDDGSSESADGEGAISTKEIVNLARMYGTLVADGGLTLSILKPLSISYLSLKAHTWLELFLIMVIVQSQNDKTQAQRSAVALKKIFENSIDKERPEAALELRRFLHRYVRKTDVAGGKEERRVVRWGVDVLCEELKS